MIFDSTIDSLLLLTNACTAVSLINFFDSRNAKKQHKTIHETPKFLLGFFHK